MMTHDAVPTQTKELIHNNLGQQWSECDHGCCIKKSPKQDMSTHKGCFEKNEDSNQNGNTTNYYSCKVCNKKYKYRQGLSVHKRQCGKTQGLKDVGISSELVIEIIKQNNEFKSLLLEQNKTIIELSKNTTVTNNNTVHNTLNKTFNLNFFLNETCKDAMNIMDFVNSLQIQLSDLESVGELGFVNGLSKLIIKGLNELEESERPVHCSDLKRETMYVKDENKWEKEDSENTKMKKALRHIARKNTKMIPAWKEKHPDCRFSASHLSDQYNHIILESMGGSGDNDDEKANKIISKIAKEIVISKST